jgi:hypothetical protein
MGKFATRRKKAKGNKEESIPTNSESLEAAKLAYKKSANTVDAVKLVITIEEAKVFKLYKNLLSRLK